MSSAPAQIPPADELASVRDQIAALKARDAELRALLLSDPSARTGNKFLAEVVTVTQSRTDIKELRAMHPQLVEEYTFPHQHLNVVLKAITADGEIVHRARKAVP